MSKYAQGESKVKENPNADFLTAIFTEPAKKSKKKSKKK